MTDVVAVGDVPAFIQVQVMSVLHDKTRSNTNECAYLKETNLGILLDL